MKEVLLSPTDEAAYFSTIASIGAALYGLSLIALASFLPELMKRWEEAAFPVFRDGDKKRRAHSLVSLRFLTDRELLDGDPIVIFIAFSVGVSWNLFCLPMAIGLTAAWLQEHLYFCSIELLLFAGFLSTCLIGRQAGIRKLNVYLTREEKAWPALTWTVIGGMAGAGLVVAFASLAPHVELLARATFWTHLGISDTALILVILKTVCIVTLLLGTYTLNKEIFIYFKVLTSEKMRKKWLSRFSDEYDELTQKVQKVINALPPDANELVALKEAWNGGEPSLIGVHDELKGPHGDARRKALWKEIQSKREGSPAWMLDVAAFAEWEEQVRASLGSIENSQRIQPAEKRFQGNLDRDLPASNSKLIGSLANGEPLEES